MYDEEEYQECDLDSTEKEENKLPDLKGVISYSDLLQLQCLLYTVGDIDEIPSTTLALLPCHIRHKLLLLLPVVDVCKLEETLVTADLPMNEIWQTLYKNKNC